MATQHCCSLSMQVQQTVQDHDVDTGQNREYLLRPEQGERASVYHPTA